MIDSINIPVQIPVEHKEPIFEISDEDREKFLKLIQGADNNLEELNLNIDSFGAWSNSKYKALKKCPFQFYLKYILKFKIPDEYQIQSDPIATNVGKAVHEILENILLGKTFDKAYKQTRLNYVDKKIISAPIWEDKVDALTYNINKFHDRIEDFNRKTPIKRVLTELRVGVNRQLEPTGFFAKDVWIRGVVDLVLLLDCLDSIILDHKTGGFGSVTAYQEQLDWYKVLFHFGIEKMKGIQTGVHFVGEGEIKMSNYSPADEIESNLKNILLMSLEGAVEMLIEKGYFKHIRGPHCKWCEFDNLGCRSGLLKPIELGTKRWIEIHKDPPDPQKKLF